MANVFAIHSVGNSIATYLRNSYPRTLAGLDMPECGFDLVSSGELAGEPDDATRITLYLYRVTVNEHSRQRQAAAGSLTRPVALGVDLHFLMSAWAGNARDEHTVLAWAIRQLHMFPILDASSLSPEAGWGANEVIQIVPAELPTEDVMRIWDALDPAYRLSVSYIARLVRLDPDAQEQGRPVVATRFVYGEEYRMTGVLRERERFERRVLGALRCVDATTLAAVDDPLVVRAAGARLVRNPGGLYVITSWTRLAAHEAAFEQPPSAPPVGTESLAIDVRDPSGRYLARRIAVALPRDPNPARAAEADSLFRALDVPMYPSASAPVSANWVALRATVRDTASGDALGGAFLRVVAGARVLARGLTDWRGEALVPVAGVPVTTWSSDPGAVVVTEIAASLECYFDPAAGTRTPAANVRAGLAPSTLPLPDPQAIDAARAGLPQAAIPLVLAAGRSLAVAISVTVP